MAENDIKIIKYTMTRLLTGREHSKHELLKKLLSRGFEADLCAEWIDKYSQHNIQSDVRFTEALIRGFSNKGKGELAVRNALKEHHVSQDIIEDMLRELNIDWFELALKVFNKKFSEQVAVDWKARQKQQRFLYSRGFTPEQIHYALNSVEN